MKRLFLIIALVCLWSPIEAASPYTTNTTNATTLLDDAELDEDVPTTKKGGNTTMQVGEDLSSNNNNLWLDCPSAADSIPDNSTIDSVIISLKITAAPTNNGEAVHMDVFDVTQVVVEADVTWNKYDATNDWTTGGGDGSNIQGLGLKLTHLGNFTTDSVQIVNIWDGKTETDTVADQSTTKITFRIPRALGQDIYDRTSKGFNLKNNAATGTVLFTFASTENSTAADRPVWTWYYRATPDYETNQTNAATLIDDTELLESTPTSKQGGGTVLRHGESSDAVRQHILIRDNDVADSLGAGMIIDSCFVILTSINNGTMDDIDDDLFFDFYTCTQDWVEADVTWNKRDATNDWTTAGGTRTLVITDYGTITTTDAGVNMDLDIAGRSTQSGLYAGGTFFFKIPTASAQAMYDGDIFGWFISIVDTIATVSENMRFSSAEGGTVQRRPVIRWFAHVPENFRRRRIIIND